MNIRHAKLKLPEHANFESYQQNQFKITLTVNIYNIDLLNNLLGNLKCSIRLKSIKKAPIKEPFQDGNDINITLFLSRRNQRWNKVSKE